MRPLRALGVVLILAGLLLAVTSSAASAAPGPPPPLVTDYANYPANAGLPSDDCSAGAVLGVLFSLNDSPPVPDLEDVPPVVAGGNVLTMTWTGVNPECVGAPIVLVIKDAPAPVFVPTALQTAVPPFEVQTLTAGPGTMTFVLPSLADLRPEADCFYQLDAILGAPLAVVGPPPNGSFYSDSLRPGGGPNLLISSKNGGYETCEVATTTTSTSTSTTTAPPTTTTAPAPTTEPSSLTTAQPPAAQSQAAARAPIPVTGTTPWPALAGVAAVGLGLSLLVAGRRRRTI